MKLWIGFTKFLRKYVLWKQTSVISTQCVANVRHWPHLAREQFGKDSGNVLSKAETEPNCFFLFLFAKTVVEIHATVFSKNFVKSFGSIRIYHSQCKNFTDFFRQINFQLPNFTLFWLFKNHSFEKNWYFQFTPTILQE